MEKGRRSALSWQCKSAYLHSAGAKRAGKVPATWAMARGVAPTAAQRHFAESAGGVKVAVPTGSAVPGNAAPV